jgi:hypothetical protein
MDKSIGDIGEEIPDWGMLDMAPDVEEESESIERILDHRAKGKARKKRSPQVLVRWTSGKETWEPLVHVKKDVPVMAADYIVKNNLHKPYSRGWAERILKKADNVYHTMRRAAGCSQNMMYGIKVPKNVAQALKFDKKNGNTLWQDAINKEMDALLKLNVFKFYPPSFKFKRDDGWQFAPLHKIFEIKRDLRRKAREVIGGNLTDATEYDSYASTIRTENVRLIFYLIVRGLLSVLLVDVMNAYLNSYSRERIFTRCGPEFKEKEGSVAVVNKALHGLKTSANAWYHELGKALAKIGFKPSRIDGAFWWKLREDGEGYDYITSHVDDLLIAAKDPYAILDFIKSQFPIKEAGLPKQYLG